MGAHPVNRLIVGITDGVQHQVLVEHNTVIRLQSQQKIRKQQRIVRQRKRRLGGTVLDGIHLRTVDVNHSFWVPKLAGKVDMTPNRRNLLWLKADRPGYFWGQCAEYCGDSHAVMRFRVIALAPNEYSEWLQQQQSLARQVAVRPADSAKSREKVVALRSFRTNETGVSAQFDRDPLKSWQAKQLPEKNEDTALIAQGRQLFAAKTCNACHTVRGHGAMGIQGPDLSHFGSRSTVGAGLLENNSEQLRRWLRDPESVKPGNKMAKAYRDNKIALSDEEQVALVAYLESLK